MDLPPRIAMQRKDMLAGLDPSKFWYNRLAARLKRVLEKVKEFLASHNILC